MIEFATVWKCALTGSVSLIAPCWQRLHPQLCLRLQLSQSVYPSLSPPFHQMHTTFLTDAVSRPWELSLLYIHHFSILVILCPTLAFLRLIPLSWDPGSQCVAERTGSSEIEVKYSSLFLVNLFSVTSCHRLLISHFPSSVACSRIFTR